MNYSINDSTYEDGPELAEHIWIMQQIEQIKNKEVAKAVEYYFGLSENVLPIHDQGWMNIPVKVRMEASEYIARLSWNI